MPKVAILLSTYNGEAYLKDFLDSISLQSFKDYTLYIRDDGSTDSTKKIISSSIFQNKIKFINDTKGNIGSAKSFISLLQNVSADIYMFADQDDIWERNKIFDSVNAIINHGIEHPILFHSDLKIVNSDLKIIAPSFHIHENIRFPECLKMNKLFVQNSIVGCTIAITNRFKINFFNSFSNNEILIEQLAMHDWFLALYAKYFGIILYSDISNILYRQHENNVSGIKKLNYFNKIKTQFTHRGVIKIDNYKLRIVKQSETFLRLYQLQIPRNDKFIIRLTTRINKKNETLNWFICLIFGVKFSNVYMNFSFLFTPIIKPFIKK
jgi:glycosyltransferase involved in cell wall biosynthesis